jgi:alkylation response protein AidB-like acyl-CoA dehydrogenase
MSDLVIVVAKTNPEAKGSAAMSLFLVDPKLPGFSKGNPLKKAGLKAQDTCELFFEDVRLPADALLGEEGRGFKYLMEELPQVRGRPPTLYRPSVPRSGVLSQLASAPFFA